MRLKKIQIEKLSSLILKELLGRKLVKPRVEEAKLKERISRVIYEDLAAEDKLDEEVKKLIEAHSAALRNSEADYDKAFNMIKQKLAKERKIVL